MSGSMWWLSLAALLIPAFVEGSGSSDEQYLSSVSKHDCDRIVAKAPAVPDFQGHRPSEETIDFTCKPEISDAHNDQTESQFVSISSQFDQNMIESDHEVTSPSNAIRRPSKYSYSDSAGNYYSPYYPCQKRFDLLIGDFKCSSDLTVESPINEFQDADQPADLKHAQTDSQPSLSSAFSSATVHKRLCAMLPTRFAKLRIVEDLRADDQDHERTSKAPRSPTRDCLPSAPNIVPGNFLRPNISIRTRCTSKEAFKLDSEEGNKSSGSPVSSIGDNSPRNLHMSSPASIHRTSSDSSEESTSKFRGASQNALARAESIESSSSNT